MVTDEIYMRRALQLAANGLLDASPNPMVGAVIVSPDGRIVGEGWHRKCGEGHAEVNAVASVKDPEELKTATMYVTLEPCSHWGRTPPCAQLIIDRKIPKVVVGCLDPFVKVAGRGVKMLREAGVEVVTGCLEKECKELNRRFMTAHTQGRPFITLKWAESKNGYMDAKISTPLSSVVVHKLRAIHDAILVGSGTWIADKPSLTTRLYAGKSPVRVILDRRGRVKDTEVDRNTIIFRDYDGLSEVMSNLYDRGITSLLVEGGAAVLTSFIKAGLWDDIRIERGNHAVDGHVKAPCMPCDGEIVSIENIDENIIINIRK
ncbi:MAG: bifunctional diaminohydroxyphosphoribosylaminopyrimidine deaminase/5-amino-6-(5-phosphoribosylamino)uracil reductase RibD [Duncaniella sp.]|nr:bifunctional diaminohydroxyphosphoribosylaminopyrimidine deaminase/5-amino-6-(5-phosphoribosylamino)uracil reductase RibD [Duncaniella sp.]